MLDRKDKRVGEQLRMSNLIIALVISSLSFAYLPYTGLRQVGPVREHLRTQPIQYKAPCILVVRASAQDC